MNAQQFASEVPQHLEALRGLARRLVGDPDAEDVVQEGLLRASRSLAEFRGDCSLRTWLYSITARVALDQLRAAKRWRNQAMVDACDERGRSQLEAKFADPSVAFDVEQHIAFCFSCVGRSLEPEQAAALVLREVLQLDNRECARVMELSESSFRHTHAAARKAMQETYEGLCALVRKGGACHQCSTLRQVAPEQQKGPALPEFPLSMEARLARVQAGRPGGMNDYFFRAIKALQAASEER
jgi:RNA polymerase sigma-70 factor (ECF subfamily)